MSTIIRPTSFPQFPDGDALITVPAVADENGNYLYPKSDIGWCLHQDNLTRTAVGQTLVKHCLGSVICMNGECMLHGVDLHPKTTKEALRKQQLKGCLRCGSKLVHTCCHYVARFVYQGDVCRLEPGKNADQNRHTHGQYRSIHLSHEQEQQLRGCMDKNPGATPKDLILGMSSAIGTAFPSVRDINPMLQNIDRLRYHLHKRKKTMSKKSVSKRETTELDVRTAIQELYQVQGDFSDMFVSFDLTRGSTVIGFRPPVIARAIDLQANPMIMDATFSVFQKGFYLCTTVVHCHEIQKYAIIFSAVIDGLSQYNFKAYFAKLFQVYGITFDADNDILGVIMDFSDAQRIAFIQAYQEITGRDDGIKYIKGCRVHFKRSVLKMAQAYKQQKGSDRNEKKKITKLATSLTLAKSEKEYDDILHNLQTKFQLARSWIEWWNRDDVRTTIFPAVSRMKPELEAHETTDTNAVESFHNEVYRRMKKRSTSLVANLRKTLQLIQNDDFAMDSYIHGSAYYYGKHKKSKTKSKRKHVEDPSRHVSRKRKAKAAKYVNDGDAPATVESMTRANKKLDAADKAKKKKPAKSRKNHAHECQDTNTLADSHMDCNNSVLSEHLCVDNIDVWDFDEPATGTQSYEEWELYKPMSTTESNEGSEDDIGSSADDEEGERNTTSNDDDDDEGEGAAASNDDEELPNHQDTECIYHEGHLLNLHGNMMSACYIDAPFEMFMQSIFPILYQQADSPFDMTSPVDGILNYAANMYLKGTLALRKKALELFRSFVWDGFSTHFKRSVMADVDEFLRFLLDKASAELQYRFTLELSRMVTCPVHGDFDAGIDKENAPIRTMSPYNFRARNLSATKSTVVNAAINAMLKRESEICTV
ncbi:hypothetical protein K492DRAFT_200648 [Lichtheimia hyalospora FSU 10163]|nr:hypothetical protein K492DRAFT_200648 [Lichtheimia hyalospora FSU 10163]